MAIEKLDIYHFRGDIDNKVKDRLNNIDLISELLISKGLVLKEFGLCAEPFDKYFEICHINENGVSSVRHPLNHILVILNSETSTRKKRKYFHWIEIYYIEGFYYLFCLVQEPFYRNTIGPDNTVYKVKENEISIALDEIFEDVLI